MIPVNPATLRANGVLIDAALKEFMGKYLPGYGYHVTSGERSKQQNIDVGGVEDSAHLYNLARDFYFLKDGNRISEDNAKTLYGVFKDYWAKDGYVEFSESRPADDPRGEKRYHMHVNLWRGLSKQTKWLGIAVVSLAITLIVRRMIQSNKELK